MVISTLAGVITGPVSIPENTNSYAVAANKLGGYSG